VRRLVHLQDLKVSILLFETMAGEKTGGGRRQRLAGGEMSHLMVWDLGEAIPPGDDVMMRPAHKLG
jgi:hypothetical protein